MDYEDEILIEQYFPAENMNDNTRNLCLSLINQSKEVTDSPRCIKSDEPFDIVSMNLYKKGNMVSFNGFISNGKENKILDGRMATSNGKYYVKTNVYRLYEFLEEEERDYNLEEEFEFTDKALIRKTMYSDGKFFYEELEPLTEIDIDGFIEEKVRRLRLK